MDVKNTMHTNGYLELAGTLWYKINLRQILNYAVQAAQTDSVKDKLSLIVQCCEKNVGNKNIERWLFAL